MVSRIREGCEINDDNRNGRIQRGDESSQSLRLETTKEEIQNTKEEIQNTKHKFEYQIGNMYKIQHRKLEVQNTQLKGWIT